MILFRSFLYHLAWCRNSKAGSSLIMNQLFYFLMAEYSQKHYLVSCIKVNLFYPFVSYKLSDNQITSSVRMYILTTLTINSTHYCQLACHHDNNISFFKPVVYKREINAVSLEKQRKHRWFGELITSQSHSIYEEHDTLHQKILQHHHFSCYTVQGQLPTKMSLLSTENRMM